MTLPEAMKVARGLLDSRLSTQMLTTERAAIGRLIDAALSVVSGELAPRRAVHAMPETPDMSGTA